ncbi:uncharacterized protein DNG_04219 [Cephalotrichum gorgonifer]|uniref:Peptidase A1 domain-containing protein n=1 Tax=Cephalotrichum gorgonifer TaxID=2041049 RepID=A0AAE8SUZ2_9PEZI|nr:uncharacterized protein DNG_04219 [Cephalotrichum gorgonifer]
MRLHDHPLLAVVTITRLCQAADTIQLTWTTDERARKSFPKGTFGPDGPWQALAVFAGAGGVPVPMWPSGSDTTEIPTVEAGGKYSAEDSRSAVATGASRGMTDTWFGSPFLGSSSLGKGYFETITLWEKISDTSAKANGSIVAAAEFNRQLPDGRQLKEEVGIFGLSPVADQESVGSDSESHPSILEQLKSGNKIGSTSFSVHVGSAAFEQPGSMVLGGYEQNRIVGKAGAFSLSAPGIPFISLLDVAIGVETGVSPFGSFDPISVFTGPGDNEQAATIVKTLEGKKGSVMVVPNPTIPYIYLPPDTCSEVAKHLPVTFDSDLELYLWDTANPKFARIVNSPAYLSFTLADRADANFTIKVPFALLNLTLTAPLVKEPTPYFPCKPYKTEYGWWELGRAFLQATFLAVNYDADVAFLAQAPGPAMGKSVIKDMGVSDQTLEGLSDDGFAESWGSVWSVLSGHDEDSGAAEWRLSLGDITGFAQGVMSALW